MITYKQTENGLLIKMELKIYKSNTNYDRKKTHKQYTSYTVSIPKALVNYISEESNQLYFYHKNNNLYLTGHNPGNLFDVYITTYYNITENTINLNIPIKLMNDFYSKVIITINPTKKDFFTNKFGEIKVTFE